jgi:asparagine synthase (glutamine-hydrolysing)
MMSIIFGIKLAEGNMVEEPQLLKMAQATERFATDGTMVRRRRRIGMGIQPFHTHQRSHLETQPLLDAFGNMLALDGRIDNCQELCRLLEIEEPNASDSAIVLTAFRRWGTDCFAKLVGDWAVVVWSDVKRQLILARDHAGSRTLYIAESDCQIRWSTYLETLVQPDQCFALDRGYLACFVSGCFRLHMTPYSGIYAVLPGHYLVLGERGHSTHRHWVWQTRGPVRYQTDSDYEAHFLNLFTTSILRRTGPGAPTIAQLSGGIDSTSTASTISKLLVSRTLQPETKIRAIFVTIL